MLIAPGLGGLVAERFSSRAILAVGLCLVALGNAVLAALILTGFGYGAAAIGMVVIGSGAGLLNSETVKAQVSAVPPERAGMASGIASTTRFIGISFGLAGLGAVLASVAESSLRRRGVSLVSGQAVDWHGLSLKVVGGDMSGALSVLPLSLRDTMAGAIHASVVDGFGAVLTAAAIVAAISGVASWSLCRPAGVR